MPSSISRLLLRQRKPSRNSLEMKYSNARSLFSSLASLSPQVRRLKLLAVAAKAQAEVKDASAAQAVAEAEVVDVEVVSEVLQEL